MRIKIELNRKTNRADVAKKSEQVFMIVDNIRQEIENNPELLETKYATESDVAQEVASRMADFEAMENMANTLRGNFFDRITYRMSPR